MRDINSTVVEVNMTLQVEAPTRRPAQTRFWYDSADPHATHATIRTAASRSWTVTFARELLATGIDQPAGIGDVRIWPSLWVGLTGELVTFALSTLGCDVFLDAPRRTLVRFLHRTYGLVPRGHEAQNIDATIARLLNR